jgi:uncharacterized membrane protein YfcA
MIMAVATSLATIIVTALSSIISHHKLGNIIWSKVFSLSPGILLGAGVGALLAEYVSAEVLKWVFICYLFYVGLRMALSSSGRQIKSTGISKKLDYLVSVLIGVCSSMLGIGGGTLTVPYLASRQLEMKNAVAISSACGLPIAISGTVVYVFAGYREQVLPEWSFGYIYLPALAGIVVCSVLTAPLGAILANKLPAKKLKRYFSVVIFLIAIKMIFR